MNRKNAEQYQAQIADKVTQNDTVVKRTIRSFLVKYRFLHKWYKRMVFVSLYALHRVPNLAAAHRILDVGVGPGDLFGYLKLFCNGNADFLGVDLAKNILLPEDIAFLECDIETAPLPCKDSSFDLVVSTFLLEHVQDSSNIFSEAYRVLKPGGYLYVVTENWTSVFVPGKENFYQDPTHVRPYSPESLSRLAEMYGLTVSYVKPLRRWVYIALLPFYPILKIMRLSEPMNFSPYEIFGPKVVIIAQKP
ncbi:MAG: class I SAM-dependent methyltransferase [Nitrospiraceae bacterium]|nr:class I SAM-dependent methyltransferase [Nitrospiraceae bacterium]